MSAEAMDDDDADIFQVILPGPFRARLQEWLEDQDVGLTRVHFPDEGHMPTYMAVPSETLRWLDRIAGDETSR